MIQSSTQGTLTFLYIVSCLACCASISCAFFTMISTDLAFSIFWVVTFLASYAFAIRITESAMFDIKASLAYLFSDEKSIFAGQTTVFCCAFYAVFRASNASSINQFKSFLASCALSLRVAKKTVRSSTAGCTLLILHEIRIFTFGTTVCFCAFETMLRASSAGSLACVKSFVAFCTLALRITGNAMLDSTASCAFFFLYKIRIFAGGAAIGLSAFEAMFRTCSTNSSTCKEAFVALGALSLSIAGKAMLNGSASGTFFFFYKILIFT